MIMTQSVWDNHIMNTWELPLYECTKSSTICRHSNNGHIMGHPYITYTQNFVILQLYWWLFSNTKYCA